MRTLRAALRRGAEAPRARGGLVTGVSPQERGGGRRVNVFLDHTYAFSLAAELAARVAVGDTLSDAEAKALQREDEYQRALACAYTFLGYRPRSERELRERLQRAGTAEDVTERVLARLRELGLADDTAFAQFWVGQRQAHHPRGALLLRQELARKGASSEAIRAALDATDTGEEAAYAAGLKRARQLRGLDQREFQRRLGAFLTRRGFPWEAITPAVKRLWADTC